MATTSIHDTTLLGKLICGDMMPFESKYHLNCLTAFQNMYRSCLQESSRETNEEGNNEHEVI